MLKLIKTEEDIVSFNLDNIIQARVVAYTEEADSESARLLEDGPSIVLELDAIDNSIYRIILVKKNRIDTLYSRCLTKLPELTEFVTNQLNYTGVADLGFEKIFKVLGDKNV